jgi:acyl-coenzyme A synthetase/AMP-(fatty) acid ligase
MRDFDADQRRTAFMSIAELLAEYRNRDSNKTAIVDLQAGSKISFGELEGAANDIAAGLKRYGVRKGDRILVLSPDGMEMLLLWIGIWRLGAAVCPFSIDMNQDLIAKFAGTLKPALVLYHRDVTLPPQLADTCSAQCVRFADWRADGSVESQDEFFSSLHRGSNPVTERNDAEDIACISATSGTTGRIKMVVHNHTAYWLNGLDTLGFFGLTEHDRTLEYRSLGWVSPQIQSVMPFLQTGLTLHIAPRYSHSSLLGWLQMHHITFSVGVPTVINLLLQKPPGFTAKDVPALRLMSCSTAPLAPQQWIAFEKMYGIKLVQFYGITETGSVCSNRHDLRKIGTVGLPAPHQKVSIVDPNGNECPVDVEGEITIGGPKMAQAYLYDDGSRESLAGKRMLTGDLGVRDADGFIRITGRRKEVIIRGGHKISPLQIDEIILAHEAVLDAATVGVPDRIYGEEAICFVISKAPVTEDAILAHCRESLPASKMPKHVLFVGELPKNQRGKIWRDKLRDDWLRRESGRTSAARKLEK